jgi:hypothetical protein
MNRSDNPIPSNIDEIKQKLDPAFSYLFFEKDVRPEEASSFDEITSLLSRYHKGINKKALYYDDTVNLLFLVVELVPRQKDKIISEFLNVQLPGNITFYIYGDRPEA